MTRHRVVMSAGKSRKQGDTATRRETAGTERLRWRVFATLALVGGAIVVIATYTHRHDPPPPRSPTAADSTLPPWRAPADPSDGIKRAGLRSGTTEGTAEHFHAHLDIIVRGISTPVAAGIGINAGNGELAELHTHDTSGILHIEAPDTTRHYVLGQLFTEWGVRLDSTHLGGLTASREMPLRAYLDGRPVSGNPARIELTPHREIALVYGSRKAAVDVPRSYTFPPGE